MVKRRLVLTLCESLKQSARTYVVLRRRKVSMQKNPLALLFLFWRARFFMTCMEPFRGVFVLLVFIVPRFFIT